MLFTGYFHYIRQKYFATTVIFLCIMMILSLSSVNAQSQDDLEFARDIMVNLNVNYYLNIHPDVGITVQHAVDHYLAFGIDQGWSPNPFFEPAYYSQHPALAGLTNRELLLHWWMYGIPEGWRGSETFSLVEYVDNYPSLDVYQENHLGALAHWLFFGFQDQNMTTADGHILSAEYANVDYCAPLSYSPANGFVPRPIDIRLSQTGFVATGNAAWSIDNCGGVWLDMVLNKEGTGGVRLETSMVLLDENEEVIFTSPAQSLTIGDTVFPTNDRKDPPPQLMVYQVPLEQIIHVDTMIVIANRERGGLIIDLQREIRNLCNDMEEACDVVADALLNTGCGFIEGETGVPSEVCIVVIEDATR